MIHLPDLLNSVPLEAPNINAAEEALQFAFLTGDSAGALEELTGNTELETSDWDPDCFAVDLFLDDFIDRCLRENRDTKKPTLCRPFLRRVISNPPRSPQSAIFRQSIQKELLEREELRVQFESIYTELSQLRLDLDGVSPMGRVYFQRWRLGILERIGDVIDTLAGSFEDATSGLGRIRAYGQELRDSDACADLKEFLRYEDGLAKVNLELRLGSDGKVRGFGIAEVKENDKNRFHIGPMRRFLSRLGMLVRGYRVTGDEVLERWVDTIFEALIPGIAHILRLIGEMEFHQSSLRFHKLCEDLNLAVCHPTFIEEEKQVGRNIEGLFNPLLLDPDRPPVPCDISCELDDPVVILTGPNSGGKTRLLQSLGFAQLLAQTGFFVPAKIARLRWATGMFVSLLDGEKSDQKEGRLGTELVRIRRVFEKSRPGSLVILDELCSGTNPCEGEEIFMLVISLLGRLHPEAFITTHFLSFAKQLAADPPSENLEFLKVKLNETHVPTYQFIRGVADTSLAKRTAARLGVTKCQLLELIGETDIELDRTALRILPVTRENSVRGKQRLQIIKK